MAFGFRRFACLIGLVALSGEACGGGPKESVSPIVIADTPDSGARRATSVPEEMGAADAGGSLEAVAHALPAGSNGPKDPEGMVGPAGKTAPSPYTMALLVNSAAMRAHPLGQRVLSALTGVLVGWGTFMPMDLVHPLKDVDWVLLVGNLVMGHTDDNTFLSHHNLPEKKADTVSAQLMKRLNGKKTALGFNAEVDGAERAYLT